MNVLIVYAHHEPTSFTSAMKNLATEVMSKQGHTIVLSDLYAQGFSPVAQKWDFVTTSGNHFNYMLEQKHAAKLDWAFSPDIVAEIQKAKEADVLLIVSPVWWLSVPAIMKGWFDRILAMGVAWDTGKIYESGLMRGKQAMLIMAAGGPAEYFQEGGKYKATPVQFLHPINHGTLAFCGYNVHEPFVTTDDLSAGDDARAQMLRELQYRLEHMFDSPQWLVNF